MLDFIVAVSHPSHWHSINVNQNPAHYSLLARTLGSGIIGFTQERVGAGAWFNVDCQVRGRTIKYGVVSVDTLVRDLMDWETLYFAGRMHKPLHILRSDPRVRLANQVNLSSAVRAALLLLPETFAEEDLYAEIAGLSYRGDFRMAVGENPRKVRNIVEAQGEQFQEVYKPILNSFHKHISFMGPEGSGSIRQDIDPKAKANLAKRLPARLRDAVKTHYDRSVNTSTAFGRNGLSEPEMSRMEEQAIWTKLVSQGDFKKNLDASVYIAARSSARKTLMCICAMRRHPRYCRTGSVHAVCKGHHQRRSHPGFAVCVAQDSKEVVPVKVDESISFRTSSRRLAAIRVDKF